MMIPLILLLLLLPSHTIAANNYIRISLMNGPDTGWETYVYTWEVRNKLYTYQVVATLTPTLTPPFSLRTVPGMY